MRRMFITILMSFLLCHVLQAADYKVAARAHQGIAAAVKNWQPTLDFLTKHIPEHTFSLIPVLSLNELTQRAGRGEFDFVLTNPSSYVEIAQLHNAVALVTLNNKRGNTAQSRFGSVIFTHAANDEILSIKDLKGKTMMIVSEPAFGGWRVPLLEMLEQGFDPYRELSELILSKSKTQQEVVHAVIDRKVDAGVVRTDLLERLEAAGEIDMRYLRIINNKDLRGFPFFLSTKLYPEWAFAALKHIPDEQALQITRILLGISKDSQAAMQGNYVGWNKPSDYGSVQNLMQQLKVGPYAEK